VKILEKKTVFYNTFNTSTYGSSGECHCGIFHYDSVNQWDNDHNNILLNAQNSAKESPELYQFQDNAIEYVNLNERLYVIDCRCKMDNFIFGFLHEEKENILKFYMETRDRICVEALKVGE
jgi:hypothetical protein